MAGSRGLSKPVGTWLATGGFLICVVGAGLPWATVAAERRSGVATANVLLGLSETLRSDGLRYLGVLWYVSAFGTIATWTSTAIPIGERIGWVVRRLALATSWIAGLLFIALGALQSPLHVSRIGPLVAAVGMTALSAASLSDRPAASPSRP